MHLVNKIQRLFVYGTLAPGNPNHEVMESISGSWEPASLKGRLIEEGWGAAMGSPGIYPTPDGEEVEGFVFSSENLADHWARLDAFEGKGYKRMLVTVRVNRTLDVEANVYALDRDA